MDYIAHQAPLFMGFSRQEYWSGLPCPPPGDLPDPGIEPVSSALERDSLPSEGLGKPLDFPKGERNFPGECPPGERQSTHCCLL